MGTLDELRVREWVWTQPRRARLAALGAVVAAVAVGGAFVGLRHDEGSAGRARHRQFAGSVDSGPVEEGEGAGARSGSAAPAGDGSHPAAGPTGTAPAATGSRSTGTTASGPAATVPGASSSTSTGVDGQSDVSAPGKKVTAPSAAPKKAAPPGRATVDGAGWGLLPKAPIAARAGHTAVWTGREMVIWGGTGDLEADPFTDGAAFDPAARTWRKIPAAPLSPRFNAGAFWTGREMIVFGGTSVDGDQLADGAAWDPASGDWRKLPASPLGPRDSAVVAWAGDRLVVWGGATVLPPDAPDTAETEMRNDGAAYVPATDSWVAVAAAPIPARSGAESVWTGSRLVVSGGYHEGDDDDRSDGAALDPVSGAWSPIAARPAPGSCGGDTACGGVWTGTTALLPASGLAYDPAGDRWSAVAPSGPDGPAAGEPAVWTGRRLLAWGVAGGSDDAGAAGNPADDATPAGGMYDPVTNRWQSFAAGPLSSRNLHTATWTGQEMLIWGGVDPSGDSTLADGAAYTPE
jgi:hypothetical protein